MQSRTLLHLSLISGIGPVTMERISQTSFDGDLYACLPSDLVHLFGVSTRAAQSIYRGLSDKKLLDTELDLLEKHNVRMVTLFDDDYPHLLKQIHGVPPVLYYEGAPLNAFEKSIAFVGSRMAHHYAQQCIEQMVPECIAYNYAIISGGALGADTMAHEQALQHGGHTVAVLGSGLLHPYPRSNKSLFNKIVAHGGTILSPFSLNTEAHARNFPIRNRIISGLSQATIVVQAAHRSGTSITAHFALDQGRMVGAVPGSVFDPLSVGCHKLIKEGATPITSGEDILVELGEISVKRAQKKQKDKRAQKVQQETIAEPTTIEEQILFYCAQKPLSTDELLAHIDIELDQLHNYLFDLQLTGKIVQNAVGLWQMG